MYKDNSNKYQNCGNPSISISHQLSPAYGLTFRVTGFFLHAHASEQAGWLFLDTTTQHPNTTTPHSRRIHDARDARAWIYSCHTPLAATALRKEKSLAYTASKGQSTQQQTARQRVCGSSDTAYKDAKDRFGVEWSGVE